MGESESIDANGNPVRQSDIFEVNREEHAAYILPYDTAEHAREGAADYAPERSP